ncbi:MAG: hypothetical protein GY849_21095 [Deltaproteobacteria bacterium]|nr:hypothetical protein [Deltaproteobacteria bacterium]
MEPNTEAKVEAQNPTNPGPDLEGAEIRDNMDEHNFDIEFEPLFTEEGVSDAELMGEDATGEDTANPESKGDESKDEADEKAEGEEKAGDEEKGKEPDQKAGEGEEDEQKADGEATEKDAAGKEPDEKDKQITGLNTALHQERTALKQLRTQNQLLSAENEKLKTPKADPEEGDKFKDFKVLSDDDYDELLYEDPDEASRYLYRYNQYQAHLKATEERQLNQHKGQAAERELVNNGIRALEDVMPGITRGKNEMAGKVADFAVNQGVNPEMVTILTDPRTKFMTANGDTYVMSDGAAQLVSLLKNTFESISSAPTKESIEAELRPIIEAEVQKTFIEKLKKDPSGGFRSLDQVPGSGNKDTKVHGGTITEADYAKMSDAEQAALLGG